MGGVYAAAPPPDHHHGRGAAVAIAALLAIAADDDGDGSVIAYAVVFASRLDLPQAESPPCVRGRRNSRLQQSWPCSRYFFSKWVRATA